MTPLTEKCSLFKPYLHKEHGWCLSTKPETVSIIDMVAIPWQHELIAMVRSASTKDERSVYKKQLWAITPSSIQEKGRGVVHVVEHSGLLQFDIDPADNPVLDTPEGMSQVKKFLTEIPYTVYCSLSASGKGYWGLFRISCPHLHDQHFDAMEKAFQEQGIIIDPAPKSTASLRFICYDPEAYYNDEAQIFDKRIEPVVIERKPLQVDQSTADPSDSKVLIAKFNAECTSAHMHEILINFGFNYHSHKGKSYRFTRPGKATKAGLSVDYHEDKRTLYCFSSEVPGLEHWKAEKGGGWSCSPMTALLLYGCGGKEKNHWATAFNYIKAKI
jgi:hypothetical protein